MAAKRPGETFIPFILKMEKEYNLPANYLYRLAYTESKFSPDVITGKKRSKAGATGIAQLMPVHFSQVDPLNPWAALRYAAKYLASNFKRFNNWDLALAGYNWGGGNVSKNLKANNGNIPVTISKMPLETRNYITLIAKNPVVENIA
jgi:soluble lytic murein transglycosylase-like protein